MKEKQWNVGNETQGFTAVREIRATATTTAGKKFSVNMQVFPEGIWIPTTEKIDVSIVVNTRNCKECGIVFTPSRQDQVFHEAKCRTRWTMREMRKRKKELI